MKTKHALIILGIIILAGLLAHRFTNKTRTEIGENGQKITAPNIKQDMCVKNGRTRDTELEKCVANVE